jgi:hypothetical protein
MVSVDRRRVRWLDFEGRPFLEMPRDECVRMICRNDAGLDSRKFVFDPSETRVAIVRKTPFPGSPIRYDPAQFEDMEHSAVTGGIVAALLAALEECSPGVYREFRAFIRTVRGFELSETSVGVVGSFSDPSSPGVMNVNVPFTKLHEPRLSPLCFTWLGHELGHTKSYLLETIAHGAGVELATNGGQSTGWMPRYGRALRVRTLLQIPYTHLYEWVVLADFLERDFEGLPWRVTENPVALGDDLHCEIEEAFERIKRSAKLTHTGVAVVARLRDQLETVRERWTGILQFASKNAAARAN